MHKVTQTLLISAALAAFALAGVGCESSDKSDAEHPTTNADHPNGEHPNGEHPNGEHPDGEHPE